MNEANIIARDLSFRLFKTMEVVRNSPLFAPGGEEYAAYNRMCDAAEVEFSDEWEKGSKDPLIARKWIDKMKEINPADFELVTGMKWDEYEFMAKRAKGQ